MNGYNIELPRILSHAYLVTGGNGEKRLEYAKGLAAAYVCEGRQPPPCGTCRHCIKAAAGIHPDIIQIGPEKGKQEISVAQARDLRANAYIRPNEAARKVFIIDPAEAMNENAQNALLKVLEDGPSYGAFLLLCAKPGQMLDTVRSRCETLTLPPMEEAPDPELQEMAKNLVSVLLDGKELEQAAFILGLEQEEWKAGRLQSLLALAEEELGNSLSQRPADGARLLRLLRRCREACDYNVGAGHLLGWLCVEAQTRSIGGNRL